MNAGNGYSSTRNKLNLSYLGSQLGIFELYSVPPFFSSFFPPAKSDASDLFHKGYRPSVIFQ